MKSEGTGLLHQALLVLSVILILIISPLAESLLIHLSEDVMMALAPSAERAYGYGNRHFDAVSSALYDVERAQRFYGQALNLDPGHSLAYHQLARVEFLRGGFEKALRLIDIQLRYHEEETPSSHYMRGLILGYMGRYDEAAAEYERYLLADPSNWAALNDYAWVLLKAGRAKEAAAAAERGLSYFPSNPWLLNSYATALYERGDIDAANEAIVAATLAVQALSEREWLTAYPGNDPRAAPEGMRTLQHSIEQNMHTITRAARGSGL